MIEDFANNITFQLDLQVTPVKFSHSGKNLTQSHSLFSLSLAFGIQYGTIRISLETVVHYHLITIYPV